MVKNPEFSKKHVITLIKFRDKIMEIYNNLDDEAKERVEILFYDGKKILEIDEVKFVEIVEKAGNRIEEKKRREEREKEAKLKIKSTHTRSLLEFVRDKEEKTKENLKRK